ncbi:MAG: hypothetical protein WB557_32710, partial [Solirubrobacteraceae bacterium]
MVEAALCEELDEPACQQREYEIRAEQCRGGSPHHEIADPPRSPRLAYADALEARADQAARGLD